MTNALPLLACALAWLALTVAWVGTLNRHDSHEELYGKLSRLQVWLIFGLCEIAVAGVGYFVIAVFAVTLLAVISCIEIAASANERWFVSIGFGLALPFVYANVTYIALVMIALMAFVFLLPYRAGKLWQRTSALLLGMYAGLAPCALLSSREQPGVLVAVLLTLTVSHFVDIISGFVGKRGRIRPLPRLSPNKTTRGFAAGALTGVALAVPLWAIGSRSLATALPFPYEWLAGVGFGLTLWGVTALGDLVGSKAKRILGIKDFSSRLGRHGGYMDRLDAFVPAVVLGCLVVG